MTATLPEIDAPPAIDACVFHEWSVIRTLGAYLPEGWRELLLEPKAIVSTGRLYQSVASDQETPIENVEGLTRLLEHGERERVVLSSDAGLLATANVNHFVAHAVGTAMNRWTEEEWLPRDERLYGLIVAVCSLPEEAAAEIRRSGQNPRMVGVVLSSAGLGSPLGHPAYHAIYEAANEMQLPIVLQADVDATEYAVATPVAGGLPATAGEYRAHAWHAQAAHVSSLIMQGVFDRFPTLRVLLLGAGAVWFPGHLWRLDHRFMATRGDGRWLVRRPIDYIDRFAFSTFRLERPPRPELLEQALSVIPGIERSLLYASGCPDDHWQDIEDTRESLPAAWRRAVLRENALEFFRWPDRQHSAALRQTEERTQTH